MLRAHAGRKGAVTERHLGLLGPPLAELPGWAGDDGAAVGAVVAALAGALRRHGHLQRAEISYIPSQFMLRLPAVHGRWQELSLGTHMMDALSSSGPPGQGAAQADVLLPEASLLRE